MSGPASPIGRILVVDDEPLVCDSIKRMLTFHGHEVETVTSGKEALALLEKQSFDAALIDYAMPEMKGDELAALIKQSAAQLPVILISASAEALQASGNRLVGVDFVIGKPFQLDELRDVVAKFLPKRN